MAGNEQERSQENHAKLQQLARPVLEYCLVSDVRLTKENAPKAVSATNALIKVSTELFARTPDTVSLKTAEYIAQVLQAVQFKLLSVGLRTDVTDTGMVGSRPEIRPIIQKRSAASDPLAAASEAGLRIVVENSHASPAQLRDNRSELVAVYNYYDQTRYRRHAQKPYSEQELTQQARVLTAMITSLISMGRNFSLELRGVDNKVAKPAPEFSGAMSWEKAKGAVELIQYASLEGMEPLRDHLKKFGDQEQHQFHDFSLGAHEAAVIYNTTHYTELPIFPECHVQFDPKLQRLVEVGAALHDIGKVGAAEANRLGLDPQNRGREPRHTENSAQIVETQILSKIPWLTEEDKQRVLFLVKHHDWLGDLGFYKNGDIRKQREVFREKSYEQRLHELVSSVREPQDLALLYRLTLCDVAGIKKDNALLTREAQHLIYAAYCEAVSLCLQNQSQEQKQAPINRELQQAESAYFSQQARIARGESFIEAQGGKAEHSLFSYALPTHRCSIDAAVGILSSGMLVSTQDRGVNFKVAGLAADYGCITFIGKGNEVELLQPDAPSPFDYTQKWQKGHKHAYNVFDLAGVEGTSKARDFGGHVADILKAKHGIDINDETQYPPASRTNLLREHSQYLVGDWATTAQVPACEGPQLNVGIRASEKAYYRPRLESAAQKMGCTVDDIKGAVSTECICAIMVPEFLTKEPVYNRLAALASQRGVDIVISPSGQTVLEYLGDSLAYFLDTTRFVHQPIHKLGPLVAKALGTQYGVKLTYPGAQTYATSTEGQTFMQYVKQYLTEKGQSTDAFDVVRQGIGKKLVRRNISGQFANTMCQEAYQAEQATYFGYSSKRELKAKKADIKRRYQA